MIRRCLLQPGSIKPSRDDIEVAGVFNPGAVRIGENMIYLLARVAERFKQPPDEKRLVFPRLAGGSGYRIEPLARPATEYIKQDDRAYKTKDKGWLRLTTISHLRLVEVKVKGDAILALKPSDKPTFFPQEEYEEYGIEDARITEISGWYYVTYVAVSRHGAVTALARTQDFTYFERLGVIFPVENKDVVLFPGTDGAPYRALHRPQAAYPFGPIEMWSAESPDLMHWGNNLPLEGDFLQSDLQETPMGTKLLRIGGGTPPVRYEGHWLEIYHAALTDRDDDRIGRYCALAVVLDHDQPHRVRRASRSILFAAEEDFERQGFVPDVVFPTGVVEMDDAYMVFYGAADENVGMAVISRREIEESLVRRAAPDAGSLRVGKTA